jgi:hypothetical protein
MALIKSSYDISTAGLPALRAFPLLLRTLGPEASLGGLHWSMQLPVVEKVCAEMTLRPDTPL